MRFFDGAVVVHEDEGVFVVGVRVALGARIVGAEVARWIVCGEGVDGGFLLLASGTRLIASMEVKRLRKESTYCHGLLVRCGETRIQLPRRGL